MLMGDVYLEQMHDVQAALSTYKEAKHKISERPGDIEVVSTQLPDLDLRIAECYRLMDRYDRAESILDSMQISYKSKSVAVQIANLRGDCYFSQGDFDGALTQYQEAIQWLMNEDWVNDALDRIALITEHPNRGPESLLRIHAQVEKLKKLGQYDEALSLCISAIIERDADITVDRIRLEIGDILALQTKALEAVSAYEELTQSQSSLAPEAQSRIAEIYWEHLGDPKQAIAAYSVLIENYPDSVLVADARKQIRRLAAGGVPGDNLP
jgi:tetratricopeptide (TPR) repeat protein